MKVEADLKRLGLCVTLSWAVVSVLSAQAPPRLRSGQAPPTAPRATSPAVPASTFQKYCFECHGTAKPEAGMSIERLLQRASIGVDADPWEKVADMLERGAMPPLDAAELPVRPGARGRCRLDPRRR